jgi:hypothetical protein
MARRINIMLADETVRAIDRVARPGQRSRFIARAVHYYFSTASPQALRDRLSTVRLPLSPVHVLPPANPSTRLAVPSVAVLGQVRSVDRIRLINKLGRVDGLIMRQVDQAIRIAFGLTTE